jgi:hypothetical protein
MACLPEHKTARPAPDVFVSHFTPEHCSGWQAAQAPLERSLDGRPTLRSAADAGLDVLAGTVRAVRDEPMQATLSLPQAAQMVAAMIAGARFCDAVIG